MTNLIKTLIHYGADFTPAPSRRYVPSGTQIPSKGVRPRMKYTTPVQIGDYRVYFTVGSLADIELNSGTKVEDGEVKPTLASYTRAAEQVNEKEIMLEKRKKGNTKKVLRSRETYVALIQYEQDNNSELSDITFLAYNWMILTKFPEHRPFRNKYDTNNTKKERELGLHIEENSGGRKTQ